MHWDSEKMFTLWGRSNANIWHKMQSTWKEKPAQCAESKMSCASRESNPDHKNGNLVWYHYTTGARLHHSSARKSYFLGRYWYYRLNKTHSAPKVSLTDNQTIRPPGKRKLSELVFTENYSLFAALESTNPTQEETIMNSIGDVQELKEFFSPSHEFSNITWTKY